MEAQFVFKFGSLNVSLLAEIIHLQPLGVAKRKQPVFEYMQLVEGNIGTFTYLQESYRQTKLTRTASV